MEHFLTPAFPLMSLFFSCVLCLVKVMNDESCTLRCQEEDMLRSFCGITEKLIGTAFLFYVEEVFLHPVWMLQ